MFFHRQTVESTFCIIVFFLLGATPCSSAEEAVDGANIIITMLPNGQIVKDTIIGEKGILKKIAKNALLLDSSTVGPQVKYCNIRRGKM